MNTFQWIILFLLVGNVVYYFFLKDIINDYKASNELCPHNIKGGKTRNLCKLCIKIEQEQQQERERKAKIYDDATRLHENEIKRLKEIQLHDINYIRQLNSKEFEDMVADIFRKLGYTVTQTPYVNDKGRDAILVKNGRTYLVECKLYSPDNSIGRRDLQIFYAAMQADKASKGFYVNTGKFTSTAAEYAKENNIELIGINKLLNMIEEAFPNSKSSDPNIQVMCLECGDIVTFAINKKEKEQYCKNNHLVQNVINQEESCNRCGSKMRVMYGRHGKFWGCTRYPKCKNTKPYVSKSLDNFVKQEPSNSPPKPNESEKPIAINAGKENDISEEQKEKEQNLESPKILSDLLGQKDKYQIVAIISPEGKRYPVNETQKKSQDASYYYNIGNEKINSKDYAGAIADFTKAIELNSNYKDAYNKRGDAKYDIKDFIGAIVDYTKVIELDPNDNDAYFTRGLAKSWLGDYAEAITDYTKAIKLYPTWKDYYFNRGNAKYNLEDYVGAIIDYTKVIELDPNFLSAYSQRASSKKNIENYTEAIDDYTKMIELNPNEASRYYCSRAALKADIKDYIGAIDDYTKSIQLDSYDSRWIRVNISELYVNCADLKAKATDYAGAIADYTKAIEFDPYGDSKELKTRIDKLKEKINQYN